MQNLHVSLHRLRWGHWDLGRVEDLAWRVGQETEKHWFSRPEDAEGCPKYTCNTVACKKKIAKNKFWKIREVETSESDAPTHMLGKSRVGELLIQLSHLQRYNDTTAYFQHSQNAAFW